MHNSRDQCRSSFVLDEPGIFRFLALWTLIGSRIIINTLQLWLCITQFCPDGFVSIGTIIVPQTSHTFFCSSVKYLHKHSLSEDQQNLIIKQLFDLRAASCVLFTSMYSTSRGTGSGSSSVCRWNRSNCPRSCSCRISLVEPKVWSSGSPTVPEGWRSVDPFRCLWHHVPAAFSAAFSARERISSF